ncbi:DoxX family protein [Patulibacter minatonensis]|uniref:DoxX family protein n=1 Tax=Patulibacter minatonensis TaxID=298163 RepID=UPI000479D830|nr:DoxX family membrane protein [Patulibacter minatonensis]
MVTDAAVRADPMLRRVAIVLGVIFVIASTPKFLAYGWERDAFVRFDLPAPGAMVLLAGVLELVGGALLIARRQVVASCLVLSAVMLVAFVAGGILAGDEIPSLTVAPLLLVAMLWVATVAVRRARRGAGHL